MGTIVRELDDCPDCGCGCTCEGMPDTLYLTLQWIECPEDPGCPYGTVLRTIEMTRCDDGSAEGGSGIWTGGFDFSSVPCQPNVECHYLSVQCSFTLGTLPQWVMTFCTNSSEPECLCDVLYTAPLCATNSSPHGDAVLGCPPLELEFTLDFGAQGGGPCLVLATITQ